MKRIILFLFCLSFLSSCSRYYLDEDNFSIQTSPYKISEKELLLYLSDSYTNVPAKSTEPITITPITHHDDTVLFLVNYLKGWKVYSADKRAPMILAMCDEGAISAKDLSSNISQKQYFDNWKEGIAVLHRNQSDDVTPAMDSWINKQEQILTKGWSEWYYIGEGLFASHNVTTIDHIIQTKWGQLSPWNMRSPYTDSTMTAKCPMGCTPVAISQMLYYLHYRIGLPATSYANANCTAYIPSGSDYVILDTTNTSFSSPSTYVWDQMPLSNANPTNSYLVSNLMLFTGYQMNSKYGSSETSTTNGSIITTLTDMSISSDNSPCDDDIIIDQLNNHGMPCIVLLRSSEGGHTAIIDGYRKIIDEYHKRWVRFDEQGNHQIREEVSRTVTRNMFAINWGSNGTGDSNNGSTIWYRAGEAWTVNGYTFDVFVRIIYNFADASNN